MLETLGDSFIYLVAAIGAGIAGGVAAAYWQPEQRWRSFVQHFAAGLLAGIIAVELLPEIRREGTAIGLSGGFFVGSLFMLAMKDVSERLERRTDRDLPMSLMLAAYVDTLIDGLIIGAGFATDEGLGILLTIGLGLELSALTLSVGGELIKEGMGRGKSILLTSGIALMLGLGTVSGLWLLGDFSEATLASVLAFAAAALLYLVTEELLRKAHQTESSKRTVAIFFGGFIIIMLVTLFGNNGGG